MKIKRGINILLLSEKYNTCIEEFHMKIKFYTKHEKKNCRAQPISNNYLIFLIK